MTEKFVYVTYIRTTAEKLWDALTKPEFTRQYWFGIQQDCDWKVGSSWKLVFPDGRVGDSGEVVEVDRPRRIVLKWRHELMPELREEGFSRCTLEIAQEGEMTKLTVLHEIERQGSKFIEAVSGGWPKILSSLKSLLETGKAFEATKDLPKG
jgi:uncharacterized protein YndB with AHSA1/START domain